MVVGACFYTTSWDLTQEHPEIRLGFPHRAISLVDLVREALRLGVRTGVLAFEGAQLNARAIPSSQQETSDEVRDCLRAARLLGRWFASGYDATTIFGLLGVRP